jgi:hypothetical protein
MSARPDPKADRDSGQDEGRAEALALALLCQGRLSPGALTEAFRKAALLPKGKVAGK